MQAPLNLLGPAYPDTTTDISVEDTLNWEPEITSQNVLVLRTPWGLSSFASTATGEGRGAIAWGALVYVVVGTTLYSINAAGASTSLGTVAGTGAVSMSVNASELFIATGGTGYTYDTTNGLRAITDTQYPNARTSCFLTQYICVDDGGSSQVFRISALSDAREWEDPDAGDGTIRSGTAEARPDNVLAVHEDHEQLLVFGESSIEFWLNTGGNFTFERSSGSTIPTGISAVHSIQSIDNSVMWVDERGIVRRLAEGVAQRMSNLALEQDLQAVDFSECTSTQYRRNGHWYYVLHLPSGETWVFDALLAAQIGPERAWHRRSSKGSTGWRVASIVRAFDKWLALDKTTGALWQMSESVYTENGDLIRRERTTPPLHFHGNRFRIPEIEMEIQTGTAPASITDAEVEIAYSTDGGRTFPNYKTHSLGLTGEYSKRVKFRRFGKFKQPVSFRMRCTSAVKSDLISVSGRVI